MFGVLIGEVKPTKLWVQIEDVVDLRRVSSMLEPSSTFSDGIELGCSLNPCEATKFPTFHRAQQFITWLNRQVHNPPSYKFEPEELPEAVWRVYQRSGEGRLYFSTEFQGMKAVWGPREEALWGVDPEHLKGYLLSAGLTEEDINQLEWEREPVTVAESRQFLRVGGGG